MNIFLIGPMATGKSHIGKALAEQLAYRFYDTDDLICQHADMDIPTIFDKEGEAGFRRRETEVVCGLVNEHDIVVATGGGVVLDKQNCKNIKESGTVICARLSTKHLLILSLIITTTRLQRWRRLLNILIK